MAKKIAKEYYLMHKDIPVCLMELTEGGTLGNYRKNEAALAHFPIGGQMNDMKFHDWWKDRAIPKTRHGAKTALQRLGYSSTNSALVDNLALSLSDCYWIKPRGEDIEWKDVNLFTNDFVDTFGEITLNKDNLLDLRKKTKFNCAASQGELQKKWCIDTSGRRYMIKGNYGESYQQSINELFATELHRKQKFENFTVYTPTLLTVEGILCIFNSILAYGAATYGTGEIHLSYRSKRSSVTSSNNINTINTTDQQKLTEYLLTELDIYKLGILLCLFMGLRLGEICALKWEDIDMISRTLHVNRTVQRLPVDTVYTSDSSQNNHTATRKTSLYIDSPKTSNSLREIPIPDFIYDKLSDYYNTSIKGDSYFLKKNQPMDPRTYQNRFHIYIREAGIGNTHFHALRHTFATNCISSGADAKSVSEILGHSNVNITLNRYVHPNLETKRSAINSIVIP